MKLRTFWTRTHAEPKPDGLETTEYNQRWSRFETIYAKTVMRAIAESRARAKNAARIQVFDDTDPGRLIFDGR